MTQQTVDIGAPMGPNTGLGLGGERALLKEALNAFAVEMATQIGSRSIGGGTTLGGIVTKRMGMNPQNVHQEIITEDRAFDEKQTTKRKEFKKEIDELSRSG